MLTAWCLTVAFATPWVVGAPTLWLLRGGRTLRPSDWLWAPFVGLAAIVCPLQTLVVFADVPLRRTAPIVWLAALALVAGALCFRNARASLRCVPWRVVILSLGVFVGQGAGVVAMGVEDYRGCMESDQYHYVVTAQFLMDEPFSTEWKNLDGRPWAFMPVALKTDRIGQSVLQGFFAVTARREALDLFYPTQLLGPALMIPAMLLLGAQCGLSRRWRTWAAIAGALAPGVELLVSQCFLSHSLCIPALVAFVAGVVRLSRGGGWRTLAGVWATFALGFAVYTEFAPLFVGTAGAALMAGLARRHVGPLRAAGVACALALALALNPAAAVSAATVATRTRTAGAEMKTGQRASVWLAAMWMHSGQAWLTGGRVDGTVAHLYFYALTGAAGAGAVALGWRALRSGRRLLPSMACASLLVPPLILWVFRPEYEYVLCKLILTLAPVLIVFLASAGTCAETLWPARRRVVAGAAVVLAVWLAVQSGVEQRSRLRGGEPVGSARQWNDPDLRRLCEALRRREPAVLVIALPGDGRTGLPSPESGALCYYARHHRIRLAEPRRIWMTPLTASSAPLLLQGPEVHPGTLVVRRHGEEGCLPLGGGVVENFGKYELVRVTGPALAAGKRAPQ